MSNELRLFCLPTAPPGALECGTGILRIQAPDANVAIALATNLAALGSGSDYVLAQVNGCIESTRQTANRVTQARIAQAKRGIYVLHPAVTRIPDGWEVRFTAYVE